MAGTPRRNENRAAASRVRPRNMAAAMVVPEGDEPGIRASAWARPTNWLSAYPRDSTPRRNPARFSATQRKIPSTIKLPR
jgi:hypothetical protein